MDYRFDRFRREHLSEDRAFQAGPEPGWSAPDFDLPTLTGARLRRADLLGRRPVLLSFASLTDPMAASAAPVLRRLHREFGEAVEFVTVYVREAHPGDRIRQPDTLEGKVAHARMLRERDGLPWSVAVDDLDGGFHRSLGGNSNAAHLLDLEGNVAFRTLWSSDERGLRRALRAMTSGASHRPFERERRIVPRVRGLARVDEVVRAAGPRALEDLRREAPLVFVAAEVAWAWRALTPLGRVAVAACGAVAMAALYGVVRLALTPARRERS